MKRVREAPRGPSDEVEEEMCKEMEPPVGCLVTLVNRMQYRMGWCPTKEAAAAAGGSGKTDFDRSMLAATRPRRADEPAPAWAEKEGREKVLLFSHSRDDPNAVDADDWIPYKNPATPSALTMFIDRQSAEIMFGKDMVMIRNERSGNVHLIHVMPRGWCASQTQCDLCFGCGAPRPRVPCELCDTAVYCTKFCREEDALTKHTEAVCTQLLMAAMSSNELGELRDMPGYAEAQAAKRQ